MNEQQPEKRVLDSHDTSTNLQVNSVFYTLQGEGPFAGTPAVFIRLAGCNLQCPLCDTEYTKRGTFTLDQILETVRGCVPSDARHTPELVVITGGEPFRQPIGLLIRRLIEIGYTVQVETNGSLYQPGVNYSNPKLTIVCSPKTGSVHRDLLPWIKAWKYVAKAGEIDHLDGLPTRALEHPNHGGLYRPPAGHSSPIYLQPADEKRATRNQDNQDAVVQSCLKHGYRLCLQLHKLVGLD